ncbi:unnamed protein product [Acanthoscelides obtectus]|uniref:Uncharacterized protein n=1 Tax=Acanthoscelides obtectus TaxID=200917 RepID=A0A9P0LUY6_ACAOB|nr:unnamed protein product [Acanthoscelides obtectus]CAK1680561.1 hypothetical protein AOBTE_LOCUS32761 [Acanthoscelides obtectus]
MYGSTGRASLEMAANASIQAFQISIYNDSENDSQLNEQFPQPSEQSENHGSTIGNSANRPKPKKKK